MGFEDFDYTVYQNQGTQKKLTLKGKRMVMANKKLGVFEISVLKILNLKDVEVTFYQDNKPVSTVRAEKALVEIPRNTNTNNMSLSALQKIDFLEGGVVITGDKRILAADRLELDSKDNLLFAQGNCVLRYDGRSVRAHKITTDVALRDFSVEEGKSGRRTEKLFQIF